MASPVDRQGRRRQSQRSSVMMTTTTLASCPSSVVMRMLRLVMAHLMPVIVWNAVIPMQFAAASSFCSTNSDCNESTGQLCYQLYDGCSRGQCLCGLKFNRIDDRGRCVRLKGGLDRCTEADICGAGMHCRDSICRCRYGRMTSDGEYCLSTNDRLLGEDCDVATNFCLHLGRDGYSRSDVNCTERQRCECFDGYKTSGISCTRWNIGERGCRASHQCSGGALCPKGRCSCPDGYRTTAGLSKCAKLGAVTDLPFGAKCDEISESSYCGSGLVCHKCSGELDYKCVRFLMTSQYAFLKSDTAYRTILSESVFLLSAAIHFTLEIISR